MRSFSNCNFRFRKMKILLEIDKNTNIIETKSKPREINFGHKVSDVVSNSRDLHTRILFALFSEAVSK